MLICLADMPYGYYQLVRFIGFAGFVFLGINSKNLGKENLSFVYFILALLFQPFFKIAFGREVWNIIDLAVAVFLVISIIKTKNKNKLLKLNKR